MLQTWWALFKIRMSETFAYRALIMTWSFVSSFALIASVFFWTAVDPKAQTIGSYQINELATYFLIMFFLELFLNWHMEFTIMIDVKNGYLSFYLLKPASYFSQITMGEIAWRVMSIGLNFGLGVVMYLLFQNLFHFPDLSMQKVLLIAVTMILGVLVSIFFSITMGLLSFWFLQVDAVFDFYYVLRHVMGGRDFPLGIFPAWFQTIANILPFRYIFSLPAEIYFNQVQGKDLIFALIMQVFWVVFFFGLTRLMWKKGLQRYTAYGQ